MLTALELVYEYRHLTGKCQSLAGLSMEEIQTLDAIESVFADDGGEVSRDGASLKTLIRSKGGKLCDEVRLSNITLDRLELAGCPWVAEGATVELVIDDAELMLSYRFMGRVAWTRGDDGNAEVGIDLLGVPVLVRRGPPSGVPAGQSRSEASRRNRVAVAA